MKKALVSTINKYWHKILPLQYHGVLLLLLWDINIFIYTGFLEMYMWSLFNEWNDTSSIVLEAIRSIYYITFPLFPLIGLVADVWTGRYCVIVVSIYCCFIGWLLAIVPYFTMIHNYPVTVTFLAVGTCVQLVGTAGFMSVILPFIIDQAIGVSTDDITSLIYWQGLSYPFGRWVTNALKCTVQDWYIVGGVSIVISGVTVVIVLTTYYLFKHTLDTTPQISNPIKLIFQVFNYARKKKYPENRSALTYYLDGTPSRIDLGKDKYGGPFKEEQVEDVKTVVRLIPLFICLFGATQANEVVNYAQNMMELKQKNFFQCIINQSGVFNLSIFLTTITFKMIIHPCFSKYIPTMLRRIQIGLGICLLSIVLYLALDVAIIFKDTDHACWLNKSSTLTDIDYHWVLVPETLGGIGFTLSVWVALEFTIAQSPGYMRGLMIGCWFAAIGLGVLCSCTLHIPFGYINNSTVSCTCLYHITKSVVVLVILVVFSIYARCYKLRVREEIVNIHLITADIYTKYLNYPS